MSASYKDLKKYCYFSSLSDGALEALSKKLQPVQMRAGDDIIEEDKPADAFFLVRTGEVEILKKTKWGQKAKINVVSEGDGFGEMALLTCSPRCCSVRAKTDVNLLKLLKADFDEIVGMDSAFSQMVEHKIRSYSQFNHMKTLQPFALLEPKKMEAFISKLVEKEYPAGAEVIKQGDTGYIYYIIKSGRVEVIKKNIDDIPEKVSELEEGEGFGEEALISDLPRNATVKTLTDTVVWTLAKPDFDDIMKASFLEEVFPEDVFDIQNREVSYLDVRMPIEYEEEHIPKARLVPMDELRKKYGTLNQDTEYYVYCQSGLRSASAAFLLNSQGFKAKSIKGGLFAWTGPVDEGTRETEGIHTPFKPT